MMDDEMYEHDAQGEDREGATAPLPENMLNMARMPALFWKWNG